MDASEFFGIMGFGFLFFVLIFVGILVINVFLYVYKSLAFMYIGKKAGDNLAPLAWIPYVGNTIVAYRSSGMHWWPWIFIAIYMLSFLPLMFLDSIIVPIVIFVSIVIYVVFFIIWLWKLFEKANWPGWMALLYIIPVVNLVILGIVAWMKRE